MFMIILSYFYIKLINLSITINTLRYFILKPHSIDKDFPYQINSPLKNLL